ncbi:MAG TPA: GNAT family N-acetyltransferase, partial [Vicinamibacterales bacterium]|nr:GNAT family N-acetyltransferase [Vicinamibacterales bacterium]
MTSAVLSYVQTESFVGSETLTLRQGTAADAGAIYELISNHLEEGHLLPRSLQEITVHANRFIVTVIDDVVVGCVDLAPLSRTVGEVRSLVVSDAARSMGVGRTLLDA